jgi:hypothetical protein
MPRPDLIYTKVFKVKNGELAERYRSAPGRLATGARSLS